jgi:hypothetical protein
VYRRRKRARNLSRIGLGAHREFSLFFRRDHRLRDGCRFGDSALRRCRGIVEIEEQAVDAPQAAEESSMAANDKYFVPPEATQTLLRVRGFSANGQRSGGIVSPQIVDLPAGTVLFRMYHDPTKAYGEWWATPRELAVIAGYFGRGGPAFDEGRSSGKGILHATMAVRHDWGGNSPLHLGMFFAVRLAAAFKAYHGEGDHAPDASQTQVQKAVYIIDASGRQRRGRQIMLPRAWEYEPNLPRIAGGMSSQSLLDEVARHRRQRLPFE